MIHRQHIELFTFSIRRILLINRFFGLLIISFLLVIISFFTLAGLWHFVDPGVGFFEYEVRIEYTYVPYWIIAFFLNLILNGAYFIKWIVIEVRWSKFGFEFPFTPLRMIGLNLITTPLFIFLHIYLRAFLDC